MRGANLNPSNEVHLPGVGDFSPSEISLLPDPCPLPKTIKKRSLNQKERVLYAPLTGYGGLLYDKDAVYIDLESNQVRVPQCHYSFLPFKSRSFEYSSFVAKKHPEKVQEPREGDEMLDTLKMANEKSESGEGLKLIQGGSSIRRGVEDLDVEMESENDEQRNRDSTNVRFHEVKG